MLSVGKSGFRFSKSGFRISNRTRNPKTDFNAEISVFGFSFLPFDWEIRKRIWKTVRKNSGLARARILSKKKTAVHENSFANPFSGFPIERWKGNPKNPDLDFLIEIHPEDGFLGSEIRFRISLSIGKSVFGFRFRLGNPDLDFENRNPDFPIERTLSLPHLLRFKSGRFKH